MAMERFNIVANVGESTVDPDDFKFDHQDCSRSMIEVIEMMTEDA